jgi:hypothetical protein
MLSEPLPPRRRPKNALRYGTSPIRMVVDRGFAPTRTLHTADIGSFSKILYPYHPLFGKGFEVFGAAGGARDIVYVRLPSNTTRGVPAWMFDEIICARVRCAERPTVDCRALLSLAHLLDSARPALRSAGREFTLAAPQKSASSATQPSSSASSGSCASQCAHPQRGAA